MTNKNKQIKLADLTNKAVLTSDEVAIYMNCSKSHLYKLMMEHKIPFSKPNGKQAYFDRVEVEAYLMSAKVKTTAEVEAEAQKMGRIG